MKRRLAPPVFAFINVALILGQGISAQKAQGVVSDIAPLRSTIVMALGDNIYRSMEVGSGGHPFFRSGLPSGALEEHRQLLRLLKSQGVRLFDVSKLLDSALIQARKAGELETWFRKTFPSTAEEIIERIDEIDAASILNRRREHFYVRNSKGWIKPLFPGISSMYWARDFAISTPKGIIIGNGKYYSRNLENSIARIIFQFAPEVKDFPIVFDAGSEDILLDGGDTIVLDETTVILGIGNRSSREAAPLLARKLNMDVLAVDMPPGDQNSGVRRLLLHLDSIFNLVDRRTILTIPYFLEKEAADSNPINPLLSGLAARIEEMKRKLSDETTGDPEALKTTVDQVRDIGWVTHFAAGTGEARKTGLKLVDYFREKGYRIIFVGGTPEKGRELEHFLETVMYELRWQGTNVVQLAPGKVIAYEHNRNTNKALREAGIEVLTFPGELLSLRNGGPHCLLMPLERDYR
jgi:arginine deiminase